MVVMRRYRLDRLLKGGGGLETWLGEDLEAAGDQVVVKLVDARRVPPAQRTRLEHEAAVLARLESGGGRPALLDHGRDGDHLFLVQPFLPGRTLAERVAAGPLSPADTLVVAADVLRTLQRAHDLGVLHRDVKPANVIVRGDGAVESASLVDFGLARSISLDAGVRDEAVGTARYLAPEQAGLVDGGVDERSDLYSLGVVLYECLAGHPPFGAATVGEVLRQHLNLPVRGLRATGVAVPRALEDVVLRLLGKDPAQRYQSADAALADVEEMAAGLARGVTDPAVVVGLHDRRATLTEPAFVGRTAELATLAIHLERAAGGAGGLVLVGSESGGGKTRLLEELARHASGPGSCGDRASTRPPGAPARCSRGWPSGSTRPSGPIPPWATGCAWSWATTPRRRPSRSRPWPPRWGAIPPTRCPRRTARCARWPPSRMPSARLTRRPWCCWTTASGRTTSPPSCSPSGTTTRSSAGVTCWSWPPSAPRRPARPIPCAASGRRRCCSAR